MFKTTHKRRATTLSKTLLTAGLLGGAALSTLGAGSAQAIQWFTFNPVTPAGSPTPGTPPDLHLGDKIFKFISFNSPGYGGHVDVNSVGSSYDVSIDFDGGGTMGNGDFSYEATIVDPYTYFDHVDLNVISNPGASSVVTKACSLRDLVDPPCGRVLTVTGSGNDTLVVPQPYKTIAITDTWTANGEAISHIDNQLSQKTLDKVPAPLPLLGAGAAFGFSRRIRSRIKGARLV